MSAPKWRQRKSSADTGSSPNSTQNHRGHKPQRAAASGTKTTIPLAQPAPPPKLAAPEILRSKIDSLCAWAKQLKQGTNDQSNIPNEFESAVQTLHLCCNSLSTTCPGDVEWMSMSICTLYGCDVIQEVLRPDITLQQCLVRYLMRAYEESNAFESSTTLSLLSSMALRDGHTPPSTLPRKAPKVQMDILRAMSMVVLENGNNLKEQWSELLNLIYSLCDRPVTQNLSNSPPMELRRMALNCLANLVHKTGNSFAGHFDRIYTLLLWSLSSLSHSDQQSGVPPSSSARRERATTRKLISSALRALQFILQEDKNAASTPVSATIEAIHRHMFYGLDSIVPIPSYATSTLAKGVIERSTYTSPSLFQLLPSTSSTLGKLDTKKYSDSEYSEYSDSELGSMLLRREHDEGKVRLNALLCLQALARAAPKALQPHWPKFIPDSGHYLVSTASGPTLSLVTLIGSDPVLTVRAAACVVLSIMLESSKQYLKMAEERQRSGARTTGSGLMALSERVGSMVVELHVGLGKAFERVDPAVVDNVTIVQMIKCCSSLVANCSYEKMRTGLVLIPYERVQVYLTSPDPSLELAALGFISTLFSNESIKLNTDSSLFEMASSTDREAATAQPSEVLNVVMSKVESTQPSVSARVEAWTALSSIAQSHFKVLRNLWDRLSADLTLAQKDQDSRIRAAALTFLEVYSKAGASSADPLTLVWWQQTIELHMLKALEDDQSTSIALGCDCLSNIPPVIFDALPHRLSIVCMSLVHGAIDEDASPGAKAAACRTLGIFMLFSCLRENTNYMTDMASAALDQCLDSQLVVRTRASWAVGNLCDSLVVLKTSGHEACLDDILTLTMWTRIMKTALAICQDSEKIRANGLRALGGLLRVTCEGILERERHSLVKDAIQTLVKNIEHGTLKGRWNACHAMQNVLQNPEFPIGSTVGTVYALDSALVSWTEDVYKSLLNSVESCKNFKVRINACAALTTPKTRSKYGDFGLFRRIVNSLLSTLKNLDQTLTESDFGEYQYKTLLESRLLRGLDHLLQLAGGAAQLQIELDAVVKQRIVESRQQANNTTPSATLTVGAVAIAAAAET